MTPLYDENYTGCERCENRETDHMVDLISKLQHERFKLAERVAELKDVATMRLEVIRDIDALLRKSEERIAELEKALEMICKHEDFTCRGDTTAWSIARKALGRSGK